MLTGNQGVKTKNYALVCCFLKITFAVNSLITGSDFLELYANTPVLAVESLSGVNFRYTR